MCLSRRRCGRRELNGLRRFYNFCVFFKEKSIQLKCYTYIQLNEKRKILNIMCARECVCLCVILKIL